MCLCGWEGMHAVVEAASFSLVPVAKNTGCIAGQQRACSVVSQVHVPEGITTVPGRHRTTHTSPHLRCRNPSRAVRGWCAREDRRRRLVSTKNNMRKSAVIGGAVAGEKGGGSRMSTFIAALTPRRPRRSLLLLVSAVCYETPHCWQSLLLDATAGIVYCVCWFR